MGQTNKIDWVEGFFLVGLCLLFDLIDVIAIGIDLIPVIGMPIGESIKFVNNLLISLTIIFWLTIRGARSYWFLGGSIVEAIPLLNSFPTRTITIIITIYATNKQIATT